MFDSVNGTKSDIFFLGGKVTKLLGIIVLKLLIKSNNFVN